MNDLKKVLELNDLQQLKNNKKIEQLEKKAEEHITYGIEIIKNEVHLTVFYAAYPKQTHQSESLSVAKFKYENGRLLMIDFFIAG